MDKQGVNEEPTAAGWQAALDAERVQTAIRVLPVAIVFSALLGAFFVGVYFVLGRPWQWVWMVFECFQATVLFTIAYVLARRGHLTATVYLATQ